MRSTTFHLQSNFKFQKAKIFCFFFFFKKKNPKSVTIASFSYDPVKIRNLYIVLLVVHYYIIAMFIFIYFFWELFFCALCSGCFLILFFHIFNKKKLKSASSTANAAAYAQIHTYQAHKIFDVTERDFVFFFFFLF